MSEVHALKVSILAALSFAIIGVIWGMMADSGMIMFDGVYSLFSVGLSGLSLIVLKLVRAQKEDIKFPFGKAHFEPLLIVFKSLTLVGMCTYSAFDAFGSILSGGREVSPGPASLYALVSTLGCIALTLFIRRANREDSALLNAEKDQWLGDALLSLGVLIGFVVAIFLQGGEHDWLVAYVDPGMVIIASSFFLLFPLTSFAKAAKELMYFRMSDSAIAPIRQEVELIAKELGAEYKLRTVLVGMELTIESNFLVKEGSFDVLLMDNIRQRIAYVAESINKKHWVNVNITRQACWM